MHNIVKLKRSVAILAAATGMLAAATGSANAQVLPGTIGLTAAGADPVCAFSFREPVQTVTCLDQDLNSLKLPGLKFDNEDAGPYAAPRTSLGRENSIEI